MRFSFLNNYLLNFYKLWIHLKTEHKIKFLDISKCHTSYFLPNWTRKYNFHFKYDMLDMEFPESAASFTRRRFVSNCGRICGMLQNGVWKYIFSWFSTKYDTFENSFHWVNALYCWFWLLEYVYRIPCLDILEAV